MVRMDEIGLTVGAPQRRAWLRRGLAVVLAPALGPAWGLEGGVGPLDPVAGAPWSGVGSLYAGQRLLSAVAIAPRWLLTAAHAVSGAIAAEVVFRSPIGGGFASRARSVHVHPAFGSGKVDLALVELEQRVPAPMALAQIFTGELLGRVVQLVSHGGSTTLVTRGENRIDAIQPGPTGQPLLYLFDYDGPDSEATLVSGDSGSAAFVVVDGRWGLAGINTFQASVTPREGGEPVRLAGGIVLGPHTGWVAETLRAAAQRIDKRGTP